MRPPRSEEVRTVCADPHFITLKQQIIETTGLSYYRDKDTELAAAVLRSLDDAPWRSAAKYLDTFFSRDAELPDRLTEELTIGETFFFRHQEMFEALRGHVFPSLRHARAEERRLRIWSAGCSVGAEAYSLSILLRTELSDLFNGWRIEIIGTDINRRFLDIARKGVFEAWSLRGLSDSVRTRYFEKRGKSWLIHPRYHAGVTFQHHNLVSDRFPSLAANLFGFDLIVCRNVMIYFDTQTIMRLAGQFEQTLRPEGWLAVGHAEPHTSIFERFETVNAPGAVLYHLTTTRSRSSSSPLWSFEPPTLPQWPVPSPERQECHGVSSLAVQPPRSQPISVPSETIPIIRELADAGDIREALEACRIALQSLRLNAELHLLHGLLLHQDGQTAQAREALLKSIYLERDNALAHYHLAIVWRELGLKDESVKSLRNAAHVMANTSDDQPVRYGDGMMVADLQGLIDHELLVI